MQVVRPLSRISVGCGICCLCIRKPAVLRDLNQAHPDFDHMNRGDVPNFMPRRNERTQSVLHRNSTVTSVAMQRTEHGHRGSGHADGVVPQLSINVLAPAHQSARGIDRTAVLAHALRQMLRGREPAHP